jgi:hypothetical protein
MPPKTPLTPPSIGPPKVTFKPLKIKDNVDPVGLSPLSELLNLLKLLPEKDFQTYLNNN